MSPAVLFDSDHGFTVGEWIAFESKGLRQTAEVTRLENNTNHLWLHLANPDGFTSGLIMGKRHCIDARRVTERGLPAPFVVAAAQPVIRQRTRVRA